MAKIASFLTCIAVLLGLGLAPMPAQAQLARTYVSSLGSDTNDCNRLTPCRTFQAAHDKTFDQGEITVLDSGGYGALMILKSISIVNDGVGEAGVLVSGGVVGIEVNARNAYVNLRGITIQGIGFGGGTGIRVDGAFALTITNCSIRNLTNHGIDYLPSFPGTLTVSNTIIADNGGNGISAMPRADGVIINLTRVELYNNSQDGFGLNASQQGSGQTHVAVVDSVAANNFQAGFASRGTASAVLHGEFNVHRSVSSNNFYGFFNDVNNHMIMTVSNSIVGMNFSGAWGGSLAVSSFGNNYSFANGPPGDAFGDLMSLK